MLVKIRAPKATSPLWTKISLPADDWEFENAMQKAGIQNARECELQVEQTTSASIAPLESGRDLYALNFLAKRLAELDQTERSILYALAQAECANHPENRITTEQLINLTYNLDTCKVLSGIGNDAALGRFLLEKKRVNIPEEYLHLVDEAKIGKGHRRQGGGIFSGGNYILQRRDILQKYTGPAPQPKPISHSIELEIKGPESSALLTTERRVCLGNGLLKKQTKPLETLKFYSPLVIEKYQREDDIQEILEDYEALEYTEEIQDALKREQEFLDEKAGLMEYFRGSESVQQKVISLFFDLEEHNEQIWCVTQAQVRKSLTEEETEELLEYTLGQMSDGFGEGFEQREIHVEDGAVYVHLWNSDDFQFIPEEEFDPMQPQIGVFRYG